MSQVEVMTQLRRLHAAFWKARGRDATEAPSASARLLCSETKKDSSRIDRRTNGISDIADKTMFLQHEPQQHRDGGYGSGRWKQWKNYKEYDRGEQVAGVVD